ncbi:MAG: hypothetical protein KC474_10595 [Cyanobacteria bacterium HKST-UBA04]|nr:hypothetical protein [Cyanobacteria bacterium HKST-UBA04]
MPNTPSIASITSIQPFQGRKIRCLSLCVALLLAGGFMVQMVHPEPAYAKKKAKEEQQGPDVDQEVTELNAMLQPLSRKVAAKGLFSPNDNSKLMEVKFKLLTMMQTIPLNDKLVKPAYETARLFKAREQYDDAFDFFNYVRTNYPNTPFALQSTTEIQRLKQQLGNDYFSETPMSVPQPMGDTPATPATSNTETPKSKPSN